MDDDDLSFDFESKLQEQRRESGRAAGPANPAAGIPADAAIPVNQSAGSFQRNYRQVMCCAFETRGLLIPVPALNNS